jgi:hypothetical protein
VVRAGKGFHAEQGLQGPDVEAQRCARPWDTDVCEGSGAESGREGLEVVRVASFLSYCCGLGGAVVSLGVAC